MITAGNRRQRDREDLSAAADPAVVHLAGVAKVSEVERGLTGVGTGPRLSSRKSRYRDTLGKMEGLEEFCD